MAVKLVFRFHANCCGSYLRATIVGINSKRRPQSLMRYAMLELRSGVAIGVKDIGSTQRLIESPGMVEVTRIRN